MPDPRKMHQISGMPIGEWIVVEGEELWVEDLDVGTLPGIGLYALVTALRRDGSRCTFRATWATVDSTGSDVYRSRERPGAVPARVAGGNRWLRGGAMYVSRLTFHCQPGKTQEVQEELKKLLGLAARAGAGRPRILRSHFASLGAPDVVFEQDAPDLATLEEQIKQVTENQEFQQWTGHMSSLLAESPKREIYLVAEEG